VPSLLRWLDDRSNTATDTRPITLTRTTTLPADSGNMRIASESGIQQPISDEASAGNVDMRSHAETMRKPPDQERSDHSAAYKIAI